jgi:hypothetical protein
MIQDFSWKKSFGIHEQFAAENKKYFVAASLPSMEKISSGALLPFL